MRGEVQVRKVRAGEGEAFVHSVFTPFLEAVTGDPEQAAEIQRELTQLEMDRAWVAEAEGRFVGNACICTLDLTLPTAPGRACPIVPMAGVSAVGVHPTHRRRGLLKQLMAALLEDARAHEEPIAALNASESIIYGRFGFGLASDMYDYSIATDHSQFEVPAPELDLRLVDKEEARKVLPELFERQRRTRPGEPSRSMAVWDAHLGDAAGRRGGGGGLFHAVCDEGYVSYRRGTEPKVFQAERAEIVVEDLRGMSPEVEAALWRFVLDLDLVGRVTARRRPADEPIRWRLADPRQLRTAAAYDRLYVRILDVATALEARGYRSAGRLVLYVGPTAATDANDPAIGCWELDAGPDGASCRRVADQTADVRLDISALGSLYLGGFPASLLAAGGRITEVTPGSLDVADSLFGARLAPLSATGF